MAFGVRHGGAVSGGSVGHDRSTHPGVLSADMHARTHSLTLAALLAGLTIALGARQNFEDVQVVQGPGGGPVPRDVRPPMPGGPMAPAPAGTAVINGVVTAADTNRPVRRATVRLSSIARGINMTAT